MSRLVPYTEDRDTGFFFQAAREEKLVFRKCQSCGKGLHLPTTFCPACGSDETEWVEASGRGHLYSWTQVLHSVHPDYPAPYTIVLVALEEAPEVRLVSAIDGLPELKVDQPMKVWFEKVNEKVTLPHWMPFNQG